MVNFTSTSVNAASYQWSFGNSNTSTIANPSTVYTTPGIYTVTLTVTSGGGQQHSTSTNITVVDDPVAGFTAAPLSGCAGSNTISFTNTSQFAGIYTWDFGDGSSSTLQDPVHTYQNAGIYNVKLIASNPYGCEDIEILSNYITIHPVPSPFFTAAVTSACDINTIFSFSSSAAGITAWQWDFGDGTSSSVQNPTHQYSNPGTYTVSLITTNSFGCTDTLIRSNYISIGAMLIPSFTMSDTAGCGPLTINFNCTVPNATSWSWDFGDGNVSLQQNPVNTFITPGTYTLTLAVTTQSGCNGTVTLPALITVDIPPVASFTTVQDSGCAPYTVQFVNNSTNAVSYLWEFGNGSTSTAANPSATYTTAGNYNVTLHAYSANGCESVSTVNNSVVVLKPNASFNATPRTGCPGMNVQFTHIAPSPSIVSYLWNFGDGTTSTLQNPSHVYSTVGLYPVFLVVTNSFGCRDTIYRGNYINVVNGTVNYTVPDTILVCQGDPVSFADPTIGSNTWSWNFGNGSTSSVQNPVYTYNTPGFYTVSLNTSMPGGCSQNFSPFMYLQIIPYNPQPIQVTYISRCKPYQVGFSTATANVVSYLWDFGDGTSSTFASPVHIYQQPGTYTVVLTLTIGAGCVTTETVTVTLGHPNPATVNKNDLCLGSPNVFNVSNPAPFTSFTWNFGNGASTSGNNISYTYPAAGTFTPSLITMDTYGCRDTFIMNPVTVNNPVPNFSAAGNTVGCLNLPVQFVNTSSNATSYYWDFGDGTTSTLPNPSHTYNVPGAYTVTLTAISNTCSTTVVKNNFITIVSPQCNFMFNTSGLCLPITVTYTDLSPGAVSWLWDFGDGMTSTLQNPVHTFTTAPNGPVSLTVTDANGCTKTRTKTNINYYAASGIVNSAVGCGSHKAQFTDQSAGATQWTWHFGDGTTSNLQNPSHTYASDGVYDVMLIATFPGNCVDTVFYPSMVTVNTPVADFFSPTLAGCSPTQINFINQSTDAVSFLWDFGDGGTSTNINPSHIYNIPGSYNIRLIATNDLGCSDTMLRPAYIVIPGTYALFGISALNGCETLTANFSDSSINAVVWSWNFGDGFVSGVSSPVHTYQDTGTYIVTLITEDTLGCTSSYTYPLPVTIYPNPVADATVSDITGCSAFTTNFTNLSLYADSYMWHFGDGDSSSAINPVHTYLTGGIYQPYLVAITNAGCTDTFYLPTAITVLQTPDAVISASDTVSCEPSSITLTSLSSDLINPAYTWDFDNGNTSSLSQDITNYPVNGSYDVTLLVVNNNGCRDSSLLTLTINPTPVANATSDLTAGCHPLGIQFSNTSSGATGYDWDFGDANTSNQFAPSHTYALPGIFQPQLIAYNQFGCADTFQLNPAITVYATPHASFTPDAFSGCNPATFTLINNTTFPDSPVYTWDFGNATGGIATDTSVNYPFQGSYPVNLSVINISGCSDDTTITLTVHPTPVASATLSDTLGCSPLAVQFTNASTGADSYLWNFGDAGTSSQSDPLYSYLTGGNFIPELIAYTDSGCSDTVNLTMVNVLQSPDAAFTSDAVNGCSGIVINYTDQSQMLQSPSYNWDFSFITSMAQNPSIQYTNPGFYDVSLLVTNSNGCADSIEIISYIEIYDTVAPPEDPVMTATVLDDSRVEIIWQNSAVTDLASYTLYRYDPSSNSYQVILHETNPAGASTAATSSFIDTGLDTKLNTYTYKLQTADRCDYKLPLDSLTAYTTVNVTALQAGLNIQVNWTPYLGCGVNTYELYRTEVISGLTQLVAILPSGVLSYLDTTLLCPLDYCYRITATDLCGNTWSSQSDTSVARPDDPLRDQVVEIVRSTVVDNSFVLTEWMPPVIYPERVKEYLVLRSDDNVTFSPVAVVPAAAVSYSDYNTQVNRQEYYYRIITVNDCDLNGPESGKASSILLDGMWNDYRTRLYWTDYTEWTNGVDYYSIERQRPDGSWELIKYVNGNITSTELPE